MAFRPALALSVGYVVFALQHFVFLASAAVQNAYIHFINRAAPLRHTAKAAPCDLAWRCVMTLFNRFFRARRDSNLTTELERQRLGRTMPGQTAAIAGARLGVLVG
jgi:hypothetical protein